MRQQSTLRIITLWLSTMLMSAGAFADQLPKFNMTPGVTPMSHDIYGLHMTIFIVCVVIAIVVFGVIIYSLFKYRKSKGAKPAAFHENLKVEIAWVIIPFIILIVLAVPATRVLFRMYDDATPDLNIKITGYQWKWHYDYLDQGFGFFSNLSTPQNQITGKAPKNKWYLLEVDKPLVVPIHKKIRFLVTSNDVIHSWWVPALGIKRDAIPGFIHEAWARIDKPGTYRGQCAELCGLNHAFMPIVVVAKTDEDFNKWVASQTKQSVTKQEAAAKAEKKTWTKAELMKKGKAIYTSHCLVCHKAGGEGMPPAFPALKGGKITTGPVNNHIHIVLNGVTGTAMQAFKNQLTDGEIAAVVTYERNSWGNDHKSTYGKQAGGIVQPAEVKKLRKNRTPT